MVSICERSINAVSVEQAEDTDKRLEPKGNVVRNRVCTVLCHGQAKRVLHTTGEQSRPNLPSHSNGTW